MHQIASQSYQDLTTAITELKNAELEYGNIIFIIELLTEKKLFPSPDPSKHKLSIP